MSSGEVFKGLEDEVDEFHVIDGLKDKMKVMLLEAWSLGVQAMREEGPVAYQTKDSGDRAEFLTGMVRDLNTGKPRFDLITPLDQPYERQMLTRWADLMARGAQKYGDRNWEKAGTQEEYLRAKESAFRHFMQWYLGAGDGEDHAAAVFFNIAEAEYVWERAF